MSLIATRSNEPIPGYHLGKRLGAGGYGEVWTAEAPGGLTKAVKFVYGLLDEERAAREMKALNRIKGVRHPFLLSLERIEVVEGQLLIVTELADCSLKDRFDESRKQGHTGIERGELLAFLRDTADALDYMNEQHSLQHLDVKPENLLLVGGRIKVADFGLVKDLQDVSASLMGGLTPIYAPPEVFNGRPSRRSDQYSLAIVYQEMLTGTLPFPGRTAAQLAAQHLNARPKMSELSVADQAIIGRALAKKPADRFASCRELADALFQAEACSVRSRPSPPAPDGPSEENQSAYDRAVDGHAVTEAPRTPGEMLDNLHTITSAMNFAAIEDSDAALERCSLSDSAASLAVSEAWQTPALGAPAPLVDLPPLALDAQAWQPRRTLFVGVGGAAARALQKLRRRLDDRFSAPNRALYTMLLIDTDQNDLLRATHGADGAPLRAGETLHLPLRKTQDYRNDTRQILQWLSRRWLYNIPRSLQTEGMRPLGRLAFVDHAPRVHARLREAVEPLRAAEDSNDPPPRVIVVSSISGGAGSGMALDVIHAVRQALEETEIARVEVRAVFLHGSGRSPAQQQLATVNSHSLLTELNHVARPGGGFPGDAACGLTSRANDAKTLNNIHLLHLGEELSAAQFNAAVDRVAEFLLLDAATQAGAFFDACRQTLFDDGDSCSEVQLRSVGVCQIGFGQDTLVDAAKERLCHAVVQRWLGASRQAAPKTSTLLFALASETAAAAAGSSDANPLEAVAAALAQRLGLDVDALVQQAYKCAAVELSGDAEALFQRIATFADKEKPDVATRRWLTAAGEIFGSHSAEPNAPLPPPTAIQTAIIERSLQLVPKLGQELRRWALDLVEDPSVRVAGAECGAKWLLAHLKTIGEKLHEMRCRLTADAGAIEQQLLASDPRQKSRSARTAAQLAEQFVQYCRLRLFAIAAEAAGRSVQALQSHVVAAGDAVQETARDLKHLAERYTAAAQAAEMQEAAALDEGLVPLRVAVVEAVRRGEEASAAEIDQHMTTTLLAAEGGLRAVLSAGGEARQQFLAQLSNHARRHVLNRLQTIDLVAMLSSGDLAASAMNPVQECLKSIQPSLQDCGGQRRLLCVVPDQGAAGDEPHALVAQLESELFRQAPTVVRDASSDVVLLFELGGIALPQAAAALIDHRADLAEASARVHTRCDVDWRPLPTRSQSTM